MKFTECRRLALASLVGVAWLLSACHTRPPLPIMSHVDVGRFMGPWYVIACTPTWMDRNAYGAIESYQRAADGRILTTFTFHRDGFDGPLVRYTPVGFVQEGSQGAIWGMRFIWPILADYRVMYVDPDYTLTLVGRQKRDYTWIMARSPAISDTEYQRMIARLKAAGYDVSALRRVPQRKSVGQ
jgi:apolipoprotein D and lipocalin family protein